ncbi:unnamed protein product [Tilletia controversa]|nr:hypothetical protein A4X03_0g911 [Tilletia caries]CAD6904605.1 unnamed protein product [Tilletia laevis]CAD6950374.1 unnamed protein product [Tilletia controversa]CAD6919079.1 unnamed protein product [Tilletia caries]CAD6951982.1 unnamed protein product [Tilletia controversa]
MSQQPTHEEQRHQSDSGAPGPSEPSANPPLPGTADASIGNPSAGHGPTTSATAAGGAEAIQEADEDNRMQAGGAAAESAEGAQAGSEGAPSSQPVPPRPLTLDDLLALAENCGPNLKLIQTSLRPALYRAMKTARSEGAPDIFLQPLATEQDPLNLLDPAAHSLLLLFIITSRVKVLRTAEALPSMIQLLETFSAQSDVLQLRLSPERVTQLGHAIAHIADLVKDPTWGLNVLCTLYLRYVADSRLLTSLHAIVLYQCLKAGAYDVAYGSALQYPVEDVDQLSNPLRYSDVLQYFYYAGLIAAKKGHLPSAIDYLEQCVTLPTQAISAIQVDAYKKLILMQLLQDGKMSPPPEYTSGVVSKSLNALCRPYILFAKLYEDRNATDAEVFQKAEEVKDMMQKDQNLGLVRQCLSMYQSRRIQRLAKTYSCISLVEIARLFGMDESPESVKSIHDEVANMIVAGWVDAAIEMVSPASAPIGTPPIPVVRFRSSANGPRDAFSSALLLQTIQARLAEAQRWKLTVEERERSIARSSIFLQKQMQNNREPSYGASNGIDQYGMVVDDEEYEDDAFAG